MKEISTHAKAAKMIRQYIKAEGFACRVRSSWDSIRVTVENLDPESFAKIKAMCGMFEYGHFNGMEDIYEYSNVDDSLPQVRFVFVDNDLSDDLLQAAYSIIRNQLADLEGAPENFKDAYRFWVGNEDARMLVYRMLRESGDSCWSIGKDFWDTWGAKPRKTAKTA